MHKYVDVPKEEQNLESGTIDNQQSQIQCMKSLGP